MIVVPRDVAAAIVTIAFYIEWQSKEHDPLMILINLYSIFEQSISSRISQCTCKCIDQMLLVNFAPFPFNAQLWHVNEK